MSDIIDRMARAAYEAHRARFNAAAAATLMRFYPLESWEDAGEQLREDWRQFMRDGLAAAREPDQMMRMAGASADPGEAFTAIEWIGDAWTAMIDELLK